LRKLSAGPFSSDIGRPLDSAAGYVGGQLVEAVYTAAAPGAMRESPPLAPWWFFFGAGLSTVQGVIQLARQRELKAAGKGGQAAVAETAASSLACALAAASAFRTSLSGRRNERK
jgi:hypothetical protein